MKITLDSKSSSWATEIYKEDNKLNNFIETINKFRLKCAISPLHDMDIFEETLEEDGEIKHYKGQFKKAHYHCLIIFNKPKSLRQMVWLLDNISSQNKIEIIFDKSGYYEYLWHKNNFEKYQYNKKEVQLYNCIEEDFYNDEVKLSKIIFDINNLKIKGLNQLYYFYRDFPNYEDYYKLIKNNAFLLTQIFKELNYNYETYNKNEK